MKRLVLACLVAVGCTQSGTGVDVTVDGAGLDPDALDVVAHFAGRDVHKVVPLPAGVGLPTHFLAELPDAATTVRFDVTATRAGAPLASGSSPDVAVTAHHIAATTVVLSGGSDGFTASGLDLASPWTLVRGGPPLMGGVVTSIWGAAATDLYATVSGNATANLLRSTDRGASWSPQNVGGGGDLDGVWGSSAGDVFLVGAGGKVYHGAATTWSSESTPIAGARLHAVFGVATDVYAVGDSNVVIHRSAGNSWVQQTPTGNTAFHALWGVPGDLWAVGSGGTILHSTGNATWTPESSGTALDLRGVFGTSATDVWIVGDAGTVLHSTAGGFTPAGSGIDAASNLFAVAGAGGALWTAGTQWGVWRLDGSAWQPEPTIAVDDALADTLQALFAVSADELFAGGNGQTILHRQ